MNVEFIVDANLPYYFNLWNSERFIHVKDLDDEWTDEQIWNYARENSLTIITKDADFSSMIIFEKTPPKVVHLRIGNMRMKEMHEFLNENWEKIEKLLADNKLVNVYKDKLESIN
jgi:predicted nuclease of predicted toxin-antitoxin system